MPYNMETLTQELVPRLCDELKRKPHGKPQSKDDRNFAFDTAGPLLRGYLARCRAALIQKQAEAGRLHQILKQTETGEDTRRRLAEYRGHDRDAPAGDAG